jgi:nucleoside phosphorylase
VATVSSLADSTLRHDTLAPHFDCVEMETAWILAAAQANRCPARAILAISDTNHDGDIFSSQADVAAAALRAAMRHALEEW